ncbi:hypothetical protein ABZ490_46520 [Streptomyces sp. NPDC005811]|uniref:hypothetical protein n=1 Tax=Streptomyces sp. NPDC005811 TaxID=3154565 RepID=UPI0033DC3EC6
MESVALIVTALAAGAAAGAKDMGSAAVRDAYAGLRELVRRRIGGDAEGILARDSADPEQWQERLTAALINAGVAESESDEALAAARSLLDLLGTEAESGKYVLDLREAKGVQTGDGNVQLNHFT